MYSRERGTRPGFTICRRLTDFEICQKTRRIKNGHQDVGSETGCPSIFPTHGHACPSPCDALLNIGVPTSPMTED